MPVPSPPKFEHFEIPLSITTGLTPFHIPERKQQLMTLNTGVATVDSNHLVVSGGLPGNRRHFGTELIPTRRTP